MLLSTVLRNEGKSLRSEGRPPDLQTRPSGGVCCSFGPPSCSSWRGWGGSGSWKAWDLGPQLLCFINKTSGVSQVCDSSSGWIQTSGQTASRVLDHQASTRTLQSIFSLHRASGLRPPTHPAHHSYPLSPMATSVKVLCPRELDFSRKHAEATMLSRKVKSGQVMGTKHFSSLPSHHISRPQGWSVTRPQHSDTDL